MNNRRIFFGWNLESKKIKAFVGKKIEGVLLNIKPKNQGYAVYLNDEKTPFSTAEDLSNCPKLIDILDIDLFDSWEIINENDIDIADIGNAHAAFYQVGSIFNQKIMLRNTIASDNTLNYLKNMFMNIGHIHKKNDLTSLKNSLTKYPAIIVSAGPSLNKQIDLLKKYQGSFIIICVNQILKLLLSNGITPDIVISLDSGSTPNWERHEIPENTFMFADVGVSKHYLQAMNNNSFFTSTNNDLISLMDDFGASVNILPTGGSVATSAYALARHLGCNPIVFIGQDLALTDGKDHADGYKDTYSKSFLEERTRLGFYVPGYYGGYVKTERQLNFYLKWFEEAIKIDKETIIFNSTEGGANIAGAKNIPFATVCNEISQFNICKNLIDFSKIFNSRELNDPQKIQSVINTYHKNINLYVNDLKAALSKESNGKVDSNNNEKINSMIRSRKNTKEAVIVSYFAQTELQKTIKSLKRNPENFEVLDSINSDLYLAIIKGGEASLLFLNEIIQNNERQA
jgi:hypothetical protein